MRYFFLETSVGFVLPCAGIRLATVHRKASASKPFCHFKTPVCATAAPRQADPPRYRKDDHSARHHRCPNPADWLYGVFNPVRHPTTVACFCAGSFLSGGCDHALPFRAHVATPLRPSQERRAVFWWRFATACSSSIARRSSNRGPLYPAT